jgi:hypothetical protein
MAAMYLTAVVVGAWHPRPWLSVVVVSVVVLLALAVRWFIWANSVPVFRCPRCSQVFLSRSPRALLEELVPPTNSRCQACGLQWGTPKSPVPEKPEGSA